MDTIKNLPFFNVVADGIASLNLVRGPTYHRIILELGGTFTKAMITDITAKINGKEFYNITGSRLDSINKYKGIADDASYLTIDFSEIFAKTPGGMYAGGIGTDQGVQSFTLEVTIAGATSPTLASYSIISAPKPMGLIAGLTHHPVTFSAGGKYPIVLPYGPETKHLIKRVHFFHTNMTHLEVKKNGVVIFGELALAVNNFILEEHGKSAQSGLFVYDRVYNDDMTQVLNTSNAKSLEFNPTVSASDTINVYAELVGTLPNF